MCTSKALSGRDAAPCALSCSHACSSVSSVSPSAASRLLVAFLLALAPADAAETPPCLAERRVESSAKSAWLRGDLRVAPRARFDFFSVTTEVLKARRRRRGCERQRASREPDGGAERGNDMLRSVRRE